MRGIISMLRSAWHTLLKPQFTKQIDSNLGLLGKIILWGWSIAGLILGAFIAPPLAQHWNIASGTLLIGGFSVQYAFGLTVALSVSALVQKLGGSLSDILTKSEALVSTTIGVLMPLAAVGYALYGYVTHVGIGLGKGLVTTAFVGGLLIKYLLFPLGGRLWDRLRK